MKYENICQFVAAIVSLSNMYCEGKIDKKYSKEFKFIVFALCELLTYEYVEVFTTSTRNLIIQTILQEDHKNMGDLMLKLERIKEKVDREAVYDR